MDDFFKFTELDELSKYDEPTIRIVSPDEYNQVGHTKVSSEALDYIKNVKPEDGRTTILVLAMTAGEWYGPNRNGDAWPELPLQVGPTKITEDQVLPKHYKSFETDANIFKHHVNKDPEKRIGDVLKAFYNWPMHRVELLLSLLNDKAQDIVERIEKGEFPAVSMGCKVRHDVCFTADAQIDTEDGLQCICDVEEGTLVRTHTGSLQPVYATMQRKYSGNLYSVNVASIAEEFSVTEGHRFYAVRSGDIRQCWGSAGGKSRRCTPEKSLTSDALVCSMCGKEMCAPQWENIENLDVGDYLAYPIPKGESSGDEPTTDLAYLYGAYLGNGCLCRICRGRKRDGEYYTTGTQWSFGMAWREVATQFEKCAASCTEHTIGHREYPEKNEIAVQISDRKLSPQIEELFGHGARDKFIPPSVIGWSEEARRALLAGYLDTDGHVDPKKGSGRIGSVNHSLIYATKMLFASLGCPTAIHKETPYSQFTGQRADFWVLSFGASTVNALREYSVKARTSGISEKRVKNNAVVLGNHILVPIISIEESTVTDLDVYNLSVKTDESYLVNGVIAHNCSICGNKAPNRKAYCDHAKYQMGELLPNGKRVFVWNPSPRFFDISMVRRPADRLGFMMKKVADAAPAARSSAILGEYVANASRKVAALNKLSLIHKILRGVVGASKDENGRISHFGADVAKPMAEKMPPLSDDTIREMLAYHPAEVLATLSSMGIVLTTPEFIKYLIWKIAPSVTIPEDVLDRAVAAQQHVFELLANNPKLLDEIDSTDFVSTPDTKVNPELKKKLTPLQEKRSQTEGNLYRLALRKIAGGPHLPMPTTPLVYRNRATAHISKLAGAGALLSAAYGLFADKTKSDITLRPFDDSPYESDGEFSYKVSSFDRLDEANAILRMAMDFSHQRRARGLKVASLAATLPDELSFDEAATRIGRLICPSN